MATPPHPPLRVLIVNTVALNAGDAAILFGEIQSLRDAYGGRVSITVADDAPEAARRLYPDIDFVPGLFANRANAPVTGARKLVRSLHRRRIAMAVRLMSRAPRLAEWLLDADARAHFAQIRKADVVIATGGTYLVETYPYVRRLHALLAAQALDKPTYLYTQSLGPFRSRRNRRLVGRVLRRADGIFVRDERSRDHLLEVGLPGGKIAIHPDAAFALAGDVSAPPRNARPRVAVSVRDWSHFRTRDRAEGRDAYRRAVAGAVRHLHSLGAEVTFVSTCQGVAEYWTDDSSFARNVVEELLHDLSGIHVDSMFRRPSELVEYLRDFDLAIATRMHFAILALAAGVSVVPVAYEFKTAELFAGLGFAELVEDVETITSAGLIRRVHAALDARAELRARIAEALPALRRDAAEPARAIRGRHPAGAAGGAPAPAHSSVPGRI